jgi:hypothetical protein
LNGRLLGGAGFHALPLNGVVIRRPHHNRISSAITPSNGKTITLPSGPVLPPLNNTFPIGCTVKG